MADFSTNPQPSLSSSQRQSLPSMYQYQYQSLATVNVANFVTVKLSSNMKSNNYAFWKLQMESLIESHDLFHFIDVQPSYLKIELTTANDAELYDIWRTDKVLRGWILGTILKKKLLATVANLDTSRKVWMVLESKFTKTVDRPTVTDHIFFDEQIPLLKAALNDEWETALDILDNLTIGVSKSSYYILSAFHAAVSTGKATDFVKNLIAYIHSDEWMGLRNDRGHTALHIAAAVGNIEAAKLLVKKSPELCNIPGFNYDLPIHSAAQYSQRDMLQYLRWETKPDPKTQHPYAGEQGLLLLLYIIDAEFFDIALTLVERFPNLAHFRDRNEDSALVHTVGSRVFLERERINFWGRCKSWLPCIWTVKEKSMVYKQALKLVKSLCHVMQGVRSSNVLVEIYENAILEIYEEAILKAAKLGVTDVLEIIMGKNLVPYCIYGIGSRQFIFHKAAKNREECVFNLIYQGSNHKHLISNYADENGNNILHLAAQLAPSDKLNEISGAALQMQRELRWFEEVKRLVLPFEKVAKNLDGKTPTEIFMREHKKLEEEGEKWAKHTAQSYTIAAALIATVMFAAAITVPGGNENNTGHPMFAKDAVFIVFTVSDALSLYTAIASLLFFLAILTSRYAIKDFERDLPQRMILGLATLFLSMTFMMISFGATLHLMIGQNKQWVLILVFILVCFPIISFVLLQCPLMFDLISSTYFPITLGKKSHRQFY